MRTKLWLLPVILGALLSAPLLSFEDPCNTNPCQVKIPEPCPCDDPGPVYNQGQGLCPDRLDSGYNAPAAYDVCGSWDFFASASFIYWKLYEEGLSTGRVTGLDSKFTNQIDAQIKESKWKYTPGFIVALGMNFAHDGWVLLGEYTRINGTNNTYNQAPEGGFIAPFWIDTINLSTAKIRSSHHRWKYELDLGDLSLGRPFYCGTYLTLKPFMGIRGGRINQNFLAIYNNTSGPQSRCYNKSRSWLVGPKIGMDSSWYCCSDFRLIGNIGASLFYQKFTTKLIEADAAKEEKGLVVTIKGKDKKHSERINPQMNAEFGLGWGRYFDRSNWHVDIIAKYVFQVYCNQNTMRSLNESSYIGISPPVGGLVPFHLTDAKPGDLSLHGLTLSAQLDF